MRAEAKPLNFITNEGIVKIPFFQRSYVWDETNWEELFDDLSSEKNHFLGSLIFKQQNPITGQPKEVLLIDGQQRLTTLSILLKAIYNNFNETLKNNVKLTLFNYLYFKKNVMSVEFEPKIKHSKNDSPSFEIILMEDDPAVFLINTDSNKILNCYKYFDQRIKKLLETDLEQTLLSKLFAKIIDYSYKLFVVIDLEVNDDEQEIFDTINSSGVRLSSADIIKNAIFQRAISVNNNQDEISALFHESWERIFQPNIEIEKEWLTQRNTGRIKRDNIEILLHSFAVIKGFFDPSQNKLANLSSLYKKYIQEFDFAGIQNLLNEISAYANIFYENIISETDFYSYENQIHRTLHIIEELELTTFYPLILYILKENVHQNDNLYALEKYIIRRAIANKTPKNYNKEVTDFINDLDSLHIKANTDTTNEEVALGLTNISNSKAALLLFWLELHRRSVDAHFGIKELKYNYTLEHILPKKWTDHWNNIPVYDENDVIVTDTERAFKVRNILLNSIGNMTLLTSKLNTAISNSEFSIKLNGNQRRKGIKHYTDLSLTKEIYQLPNGLERTNWDERDIRARNQYLYNEIVQIW